MSAESLKEKARSLRIDPDSGYTHLQKLIVGGFFDSPVSSEAVVLRISEKAGKRWRTSYVQT